jgi:hypothetical protein
VESPIATQPFRSARRAWATLLCVAALCVCIAATLSAVFCWIYWGYILSPPGVHPDVLAATRVVAQGPIDDDASGIFSPDLSLDTFASMRDGDGAWRLVPPTVDVERWQADWRARGVVPPDLRVPAIDPARSREIIELIQSTASLVRGAYGDGFPDSRSWINAYELLGPHGEKLLFVAMRTGELSNDHLAYYELLYDDSVAPPRLLDRRQWYHDVAGLEGLEFATVTTMLSILLLAVAMPPTAGILLYRRYSKGARIAYGHCPKCNYDLRSSFENGCSECGWGAGSDRASERDLRRYAFIGRIIGAATRSPRWRTLGVLAIGCALVWRDRSMPGQTHWGNGVGKWLLLAGTAVLMIKCVSIWFRPAWLEGHPSILKSLGRFATGGTLVACAIAAMKTEWPLEWRFQISRTSLERVALDAQKAGLTSRAPVVRTRRAGLYVVDVVAQTTDSAGGMILWVGGAGGDPVMSGFLWYPHDVPERPSAYGTKVTLYQRFAPGWYLWDYDNSR